MPIEAAGKTCETDEEGYLINLAEWNEDVANVIAKTENVEMTPNHWESSTSCATTTTSTRSPRPCAC